MTARKYINYLILSLIIVIIFICILNYIVDPLLYYKRDKRILSPLYTEEQRFLIPGLIKNSPGHNAVIIGTSMAGNFSASEASKLLKEKTVKLTIDGATLYEQSYVLSKYLDSHPAAIKIIWGIDPMLIDIDPAQFTIRPYDYPFFLYEDSIINLRYLLSYSATIHSLQTIMNNLLGIEFFMKTRNLDRLHTWPDNTAAGCKQVMENYNKLSTQHIDVADPLLVPFSFFNENNATANLNKIVELAQRRKNAQFVLFLPPYSIVRYLFEDEHNGLERILKARNFIASRTKGIENINIIDLEASEDIIGRLDYYMDMLHHVRTINTLILQTLINNDFTGYESIRANTDKLRLLVRKSDFETIKKCKP